MLSLDIAKGDVHWMYCTGGEVWHPPVPVGDRVYIGDGGREHRHIYCLTTTPRSRLGDCLWRYNLDGLAAQGVVVNGVAYWGCHDRHLYALDAGSGHLLWRFRTSRTIAEHGPPCVIRDWVFAGCKDGYVYGLDVRTGALRWKHFLVDEDAIQAEVEEKSAGTQAADDSTGWSDEERREYERWEASFRREEDQPQQNTEDATLPSLLGIVTWEGERRLYALTTQGFLYCFQLPEASV